MKFTHLHTHSHYSLLDGLPKIDELLDYAKELGMEALALTDHGALYGAVEFYKKAKELGIKPILGSEVYLAYEKMTQKRPNIDDKKYHLVLLIKNEEGYKNLVKLLTRAHLDGFYYKPRIDEDLLSKYSSGLICLSGCLQGKIPKLILAKKIDEVEKISLKYQEIFGKDNFYLEIQHHPNILDQKIVNKALISISKKLNIPLVATNDIHYLKPEDAEAQDILMLVNTGADPNNPERLTLKADDFSMRSPQKMKRDFKDSPEAILNTQKIADLCNFQFELGKIQLPQFKALTLESQDKYLEKLCFQGLKKRYGQSPKKKVLDRLNYELSIIEKTGFASYFLIVQDFVNWAKENGIIVGPGRGSAGGSLVSYLLNITNVDPIKYNLLFERFLTGERISLPDIDLDFTDQRRDEVINYVAKRYGRNKVAQIITFGTMAARAAVRDVGRALNYSYSYCDRIAKMIPMGFTLDQTLKMVEEFYQIYKQDLQAKKLIDFAKKLEGVARHASTHACGVVISAEPLENLVPLQHPTQDDESIVTQYEMHSIEDLGLLKIDLLGLKNLTIIENTINLIKERGGLEINIENLPLDDKKAYQLLQEGKTTGVFQLEGEGMKRYLKQLKPTIFEDITAMIALFRPGPMKFIPEYINRKYKKKKVEYLHPKLKPILEKTYGLPVYQEQLMQIAQKLAGFSLAEADVLRKAIGKKIRSLLISQKEKFIEGMIKNKIRRGVALKIWDWILPFARYGFNRAHSCCYAQIAYQTAYLKANFPCEFMAALLNSEQRDVERIGFLIDECKKMGIKVLPPEINESDENFTIGGENQIRFGLSAIKNVGWNFVEEIVKERKRRESFNSISNFLERVNTKDLNKKSMESLIRAGVFDKFGERNCLLFNLETLLEYNREIKKSQIFGQRNLFSNILGFSSQIKLKPAPPAKRAEKLAWEKELLGLYVTSHPLESFKNIFEKRVLPITNINERILGKIIKIGGIISSLKKIITKKGQPMLFLTLEDLTDKIEVIAFPSVIKKNPAPFQENKIVLISGRVDNRDGAPKIICEEIEEIVES
ncbi:DNA polymerase III subunit alpha [Patescibacteria group bacterium]|nr:DNA polymerase III subunit alpha [Patescibacteria group bacterium]